MEKEKESFEKWVRDHKKQLILAGISVSAMIVVIISAKNRDKLLELWGELKRLLSGNVENTGSMHLENIVNPINTGDVVETFKNTGHIGMDFEGAGIKQIDVHKHVRNLAPGYSASPEKVASAVENGIELLENQTWVKDYTKNIAKAA